MKHTRSYLHIFIPGLILFALILFFRQTPSQNQKIEIRKETSNGKTSFTATESFFDFGTISMANGKVRHAFQIKNDSTESVTISRMYTSCMCTTATLTIGEISKGPFSMPGHGFIPKIDEVVEKGAEGVIEVVFDPGAHGSAGVGTIQRSITLEEKNGSVLVLSFKAVVTP